jgi:thymidine phosphorylase
MNEPLATAAGNAVEVLNAVEFLTGAHVDPRLWDVTVALGGELLALGGLAGSDAEGRDRIEKAFRSGRAAEIFGRMTAALGGPADFMERPAKYLKAAPVIRDVFAKESGTVAAIDTHAIDHTVGFTKLVGLGARVGKDAPLAIVHAKDEVAAARATEALRAAYRLGAAPPSNPTVYERIGP